MMEGSIARPTAIIAFLLAWAASASPSPGTGTPPYPSLRWVESALVTTARDDFRGRDQAYHAATRWDAERLRANPDGASVPHLACAEYRHGREALLRLQDFLAAAAVKPVSFSDDHGACFVATASRVQSEVISADPARFGLLTVGPLPSVLKLSPGLLDHGDGDGGVGKEAEAGGGFLSTTHGVSMRMDNVEGLSMELSPGALPAHDPGGNLFIGTLVKTLMSDAVDLHAGNMWSDPAMAEGEHLATPEGARRGREWSRAAAVVHELSEAAGTSPSDICGWDSIHVHYADNDTLLVSGLDHLLYSGRGAGGVAEEAAELHVACFMDLISFLASRPEVLRVSPRHSQRLFNAAARAIIQSATVTSSPLTDAGLDGTGEVIQVLDTGVDETSCFFADGDGEEVQHGYYFDELGFAISSDSDTLGESSSKVFKEFSGGDFYFDSNRRKIVQYMNLVKPDSESSSGSSFFSTISGGRYPWVTGDEFETDAVAGHGTHTAGSAAGATLNTSAVEVSCLSPKVLGCAGACISDDSTLSTDDLVSSYFQETFTYDIDRLCPMFDCGGQDEKLCLSDDVGTTLAEHGGMAQGAKLAIFDIFSGLYSYGSFAGNGVWEACLEAGCKIHSNSYGGDFICETSSGDIAYDNFMYQNTENLLIFAAGNEGDIDDGRSVCTIASPAIAKNVLAIGATSSGETRLTTTGADGGPYDGSNGIADMDTVAFFSSYGPTQDNRIKPEIVAPGDVIYSATSDGTDQSSCRLWAYRGTSMSCPIVAGAAAMVRQYFVDASFYAADVTSRGFCSGEFLCEGFSPSSATIKALLINSASLMGGSSEPDGYRGFGRIHMEAGMPLGGEGHLAMFVADAANTSISSSATQVYLLDVNGDAGLDLRATLSWIDPASTTLSVKQLVHDLDLAMISPNGTRYTMWASGVADIVNVNERVIVDAEDIESGTWTVVVSAKTLSTDNQSYSLVVNGAISPGTGMGADVSSTQAPVWDSTSNSTSDSTSDPVYFYYFSTDDYHDGSLANTPPPTDDSATASPSPTDPTKREDSLTPSPSSNGNSATGADANGAVASTAAPLSRVLLLLSVMTLVLAAAR